MRPGQFDSRLLIGRTPHTGAIRWTLQELFASGGLPLSIVSEEHVASTPRVMAEGVSIVFVLDGWAHISHAGGVDAVGPGSVMGIPERVWCRGHPEAYTRTVTIYMRSDFVTPHLSWLPAAHPVAHRLVRQPRRDHTPGAVHVGTAGAQVLRPKLAALVALGGEPCGEFTMLARLADVFDDLSRLLANTGSKRIGSQPGPRPPHTIVTTAIHALLAQLQRTWTVKEIASEAAISESQLTRHFRRDLGIGPAAFLWNARLDRMAEILATTDITVAKAAQEAGWRDSSSASRAFSRRYGVSPGRFSLQARTLGLSMESSSSLT